MAVELGEWIVGLRSNDAAIVEILRRLLAPVVTEGLDVFPNVGLYRGEEHGRRRELHRLSRRGITVLHTRSIGHLLRAAARQLDGFLAPPPGLLRLRSRLLLGHSGAVLLHGAFASAHLSERRLARQGWIVADDVAPLLDPQSLEVVVAEPRPFTDPAVVAEIDDRWPLGDDEWRADPGRYPVRAVIGLGASRDAASVDSPARRLASLASMLDTAHLFRVTDVEAIGRLEARQDIDCRFAVEPDAVSALLRTLDTGPS